MDFETKKVFLVNCAFTTVAALLIYLVLKFMLAYLFPFVIGIALAFLVQKPARILSCKTRLHTGTWAAILVVVTYLAVTAVISIIIWQIVVQSGWVATVLPDYFSAASNYLKELGTQFSQLLSRLPDSMAQTVQSMLNGASAQLISAMTAFFSAAAATIAKSLPAFLLSSVVTVVASCYLAKDFEQLVRFVKGMLKPKTCDVIIRIKEILTGSILKFAIGYLFLMLITFAELLLGFLLLRVRYAVLLAAVTAVVDVLPVLGTGTVLLPWAIFEFMSGRTATGIGILLIYAAITVIRNFLEPRIIGRQMGINPLLTLITMFVGLRIGGLIGMMLLPISCIVVITYYKRQIEEEKTG